VEVKVKTKKGIKKRKKHKRVWWLANKIVEEREGFAVVTTKRLIDIDKNANAKHEGEEKKRIRKARHVIQVRVGCKGYDDEGDDATGEEG